MPRLNSQASDFKPDFVSLACRLSAGKVPSDGCLQVFGLQFRGRNPSYRRPAVGCAERGCDADADAAATSESSDAAR